MAFLIPENIPSRSGVPDQLRHVARALRDFLPEHTTVWLRRDKDTHPYLLVLDPGAGIAVIEAPPIRAASRRPKWFSRYLKEEDILRVRDDIADLVADLRSRIDRSKVRSLPVRHVVAAPGHDEPIMGFQPGENQALLLGSDMTEDRMHAALREMLGAATGAPLSEQEENRVRAEINPRVVIDPKVTGSDPASGQTLPLFQEPELAPEDVIRVMDRRQERLAEHMGWGYRMLRGVAGSGKTLVLTHRARFLHESEPTYRILLLCFNRLLANALELMVDPGDRLTVTNVDRLAYRLGKQSVGGGNLDFDQLRRRAITAANRLPDSRRYDVVLIDEAQDLDHTALDLAYAMLKKSRQDLKATTRGLGSYNTGHLVMALDSAQAVYGKAGRRSMTWNPPGVTAQGRTTIFGRNYRNTRQILDFAWKFLDDSPTSRPNSNFEKGDLVVPEAAHREGSVPRVLECGNFRHEARAIADEVERLIGSGVEVKDIAVMYGHRDLQSELWNELCRRRGLPYFHIQHRERNGVQANRDKAMGVHDKIRVSTIHGLKGLEFSRILIGGVNQAYAHDVPEEEQTEAVKRLVYVGMTRAMDELVVTYSGAGDIGHALRAAGP
jgi:hypothetical protein